MSLHRCLRCCAVLFVCVVRVHAAFLTLFLLMFACAISVQNGNHVIEATSVCCHTVRGIKLKTNPYRGVCHRVGVITRMLMMMSYCIIVLLWWQGVVRDVRRVDVLRSLRVFTSHRRVGEITLCDDVDGGWSYVMSDRRIVRVTGGLVHSDTVGKVLSFLPVVRLSVACFPVVMFIVVHCLRCYVGDRVVCQVSLRH